MCLMTSQNSLFGQISLIFAFNALVNKTLQLLLLYPLYLESFVLNPLTNLTSLFEVVQSCLLIRFSIHDNLISKFSKMQKFVRNMENYLNCL